MKPLIDRIHELAAEEVETILARFVELDLDTSKIPQPETEREKIMFLAGRLQFALFIKGATFP